MAERNPQRISSMNRASRAPSWGGRLGKEEETTFDTRYLSFSSHPAREMGHWRRACGGGDAKKRPTSSPSPSRFARRLDRPSSFFLLFSTHAFSLFFFPRSDKNPPGSIPDTDDGEEEELEDEEETMDFSDAASGGEESSGGGSGGGGSGVGGNTKLPPPPPPCGLLPDVSPPAPPPEYPPPPPPAKRPPPPPPNPPAFIQCSQPEDPAPPDKKLHAGNVST